MEGKGKGKGIGKGKEKEKRGKGKGRESGKSVPTCNRFCTRRTNGGKITTLTRLLKENPFTQPRKIFSRKTKVSVAADRKDFVILACSVMIWLQGVTGGRTDAWMIAKTREALHVGGAHKNLLIMAMRF